MKKSLKITIIFLFNFFVNTAYAIEIPSDLHGNWVDEESKLACNQEEAFVTTIGKKSIDEGDVSSCEIKKLSGKDGKYKISSRCCSGDGCSSTLNSSTYKIVDNALIIEDVIGGKKHVRRFKRCQN